MTAFHVMAGADDAIVHPTVRKISMADIGEALARGFVDFREKPSHYVFLCLI